MTLPFYVQCILMGMLGTAASCILAMKALNAKAKSANLIFHPKAYFLDDWYTPVGSVIAVLVLLIFLGYAPKGTSPLLELSFFFLAGYAGNDLLFKLYSTANARLNSAIQFKAGQSDSANGTSDAPTPATKPQ